VVRKIAVASHAATIDGKQYDGIGDTLKESLSEVTDEFTFLRHSMDGLIDSELQYYKGKSEATKRQLRVVSNPAPLRYISEIIATVWHFTFKEKVDIYLGIDPLNALAGLILRSFGRVETAIFYTADYSPTRFNNKMMDRAYHSIDKFCVKHANEVWSVSSRIVGVRRTMGLPEERNIFVPNVPPLAYTNQKRGRYDKHKLITLGIVDRQLDFRGVMSAMHILSDKYPDISLTIVGNGPEEASLKKFASQQGVTDRVNFLGRLSFNEAQEKISHAGIGLALYTGVWGFNKYGDSTKCREFFSYGLPVLSTDTHSTVEEIEEFSAGIVVPVSVDAYVTGIEELFKKYSQYSKKSAALGEKHKGAREKELARLLSGSK